MIKQYHFSTRDWILKNTNGSKSVVELGAGFFGNLSSVHPNVPIKIGIEIYQPYIDNAKYQDCIKICGDALNYKELLKNYILDTVLLVDVLEHFERPTSFKLIESLKTDFNKILLMMPVGVHVLTEDVTGFGGHQYQTHRSTWYENDIIELGFDENITDPNFHHTKPNPGCYFGVWNKKSKS